ncbi:MAG: hypothetical protein RIR39_452 [Pseudomonadota bacterium]|jgi:hypothetical protein
MLFSLPCVAELRDPTQPAYPVKSELTAGKMVEETSRLTGIWISKTSRWVIINGVKAEQGQAIAGSINIIKIRKNEVTINQKGTIKILQLVQSPHRNP